MRICDVRITPVSVPVEAPLCYSTGADGGIHRLIVELETDDGYVGLGECNGGVAREARLRECIPQILGADPFHTERLRWQIGAPAEIKLSVTSTTRLLRSNSHVWIYSERSPDGRCTICSEANFETSSH